MEGVSKGLLTNAKARREDHRVQPTGRAGSICWVQEAYVERASPFILVPL